MEKISRKIAKLFQIVLGAVLGCLGFTGCDDEDYGREICMYGMPTSHFEAKGNVKTTDSQPVENATIIIKNTRDNYEHSIVVPVDSTQTDAAGNYTISAFNIFSTIRIVCVPPEASGLEADSVDIEPKYTGGDGNWNQGSLEYTGDFTLNKKQN